MTDNSNASIEEGNDGYEPSSVENDKYKSYIDENMNSHVVDVDKVLGRGGQGIVYRTEDPNIALKLALKDSNEITDPGEIEHFRQTIRKLLLLQLPKDIKVSAPIAVLKDNGYKLSREANKLYNLVMNKKMLENDVNILSKLNEKSNRVLFNYIREALITYSYKCKKDLLEITLFDKNRIIFALNTKISVLEQVLLDEDNYFNRIKIYEKE